MLALTLPETKPLMAKLLKGAAFDGFEARNIRIDSYALFEISSAEEADGESARRLVCLWGRVKPLALDIIKGDTPPRSMKLVFALAAEEMEAHFPDAAALFMNIMFEGGRVQLTTGSSPKKFTLDRSMDTSWDSHVREFLAKNGITFREAEQ